MNFNRNKLTRQLWSIMPMALRYYFIEALCGKYSCTTFKYSYRHHRHKVDVYYISGGHITGYVGSIRPSDYWENIEGVVISYSIIGTFR